MLVIKGNPHPYVRSIHVAAGLAKGPLPIMSKVLVEADHETVIFTAANPETEVSIKTALGAGSKKASFCLSADKLSSLFAMPDGEISVELNESTSKAIAKFGQARFTLHAESGDEFPRVSFGKTEHRFEVFSGDLRKMLDTASTFASIKDLRAYMNGVLVSNEKGRPMKAVGTDGHRMGLTRGVTIDADSFSALIPIGAVRRLVSMLPDGDTPVIIEIGSENEFKKMRVSFGDVTLTTKLIGEKFPDWKKIIPAEADRLVLVDVPKAPVMTCLSRLGILSVHDLAVSVKAGKLNIAVSNNQSHEAGEETFDVVLDKDDVETQVGVNLTYLQDAVKSVDGDTVRLVLGTSEQSILVKSADKGGAFLGLIAPTRQ
jgi:DNA polymerase-3 subunit beta